MGVYQQWTTYALKPKSGLEMHFHANNEKTQSFGKKTAVDKSAWVKAWKDSSSRSIKEAWWSEKFHRSEWKWPFEHDLYWVNWKCGSKKAQK